MKRYTLYFIFTICTMIPSDGQTIYDYAMSRYKTLPFTNRSISIISIDSVRDFYILYGIDSLLSKYKIITRKVSSNSSPICVGQKYEVSIIELKAVSPYEEKMLCDIFYNLGEFNPIANEPEYNCDLCIVKEFFGKNYVTEPIDQGKYVQWIIQNPIKIQSSRINNQEKISE